MQQVVGAGIFLWRQNKTSKKLVCLQIYQQLAQEYESSEMNKRRAYLAKRLLENEADTDIDDSVLVFFEKVGLMVERGFLDIELIDNVLGFDVHNYWQALQHYIDSHRRSDHTLFIRFEKLKNDLDKYAKREYQNYEVFRNTPVKEFLRMESRRDVTNMKFIPDELETTTKSRKKTKT